MTVEIMVVAISTLLAALGGPPLVKLLSEKYLGHRYDSEDKRLDAKLATAEYERQREAWREDKAFELLESSLEMLGEAVDNADKMREAQRIESQRVHRLLERIEQTDRIQNGLLQSVSESLSIILVQLGEMGGVDEG